MRIHLKHRPTKLAYNWAELKHADFIIRMSWTVLTPSIISV